MKKIKKLFFVIIGTFLTALSFTYFMVPYNIVSGGVSGISQIINEYYPINMPFFILGVSIFLIVISYLFLGKEKTFNSILGSILFPIFVYLTEILYVNFHFEIDNTLLASLFGSILLGFGLGLVFREDYTTGGTDILEQILAKYLHMSLGNAKLIIELIILIGTTMTYGFANLMYSLVVINLSSMIVDKVIIGISNSKSFYIITKKPEEAKEYIIKTLNHGVTILDGKGAFSEKHQQVLLTVIPTKDYYKLKEGLKLIDQEAFFVVNDAYEVGGGR